MYLQIPEVIKLSLQLAQEYYAALSLSLMGDEKSSVRTLHANHGVSGAGRVEEEEGGADTGMHKALRPELYTVIHAHLQALLVVTAPAQRHVVENMLTGFERFHKILESSPKLN